MITVTVLYPNEAGARFDMGYYLDTHIPMVRKLLGPALKDVLVEQGISGVAPGSKAAYAVICHLRFTSVESFQTALGVHAASIGADVANYTSVQPIIQISDIKVS
jgi:uncharacterized protein (TIGR02118 family)